jgi:two-component system, LytTR family, sensor kinase
MLVMTKEQRTKWSLFLAVWTMFGLFFSTQSYFHAQLYDRPMTWRHALLSNLPDWYIWAAFSLLIGWLFQRFPFEKGRMAASLAVHIPASLVIAWVSLALAVSALFVFVIAPGDDHFEWWPVMRRNVAMSYHWWVLVYWAILGAHQGFEYHRKLSEREKRAVQLEAQLVQAQLQALKMQLHPHFLFNTLNSISALLHQEPELADRMIARLGDFLRLTLDNSGDQEVTLQKELEFLKCYLEIERVRFQDRLTVSYDVAPETLDAMVPNLVWQPIVENAIRHAIAPRAGRGNIQIWAQRTGATLQLQVKDDGPGLPPSQNSNQLSGQGVGLANTRERLRQLYGDNHRFELRNGADRGLVVALEIPFTPSTRQDEARVGELQWK